MTITKSTGLFYTERLSTSNGLCRGVFCQPIDITVYSAPYPAKHRVVSYRMLFWHDYKQPDIEVDYDKGEIYKVNPIGEDTFTFTTGTIPTSIENLTTLIRRHFLETVASGKGFRDKREALRRLRGPTPPSDEITLSDGRVVQIKDVRHVERIRHDSTFIYQNDSPVIIYNIALINDPNGIGRKGLPEKRSFEKAYLSTRSMIRDAVIDFESYVDQS